MNETETEKRPVRRYRRGVFWPLLLIALGVIFLLSNLDLIRGDVWDTILNLWPLILIFMGLDGILSRDGLVGPSLLIGLGTVFLAGNLGYLPLPAWETLFRLWPLFLVALGFDILIGRRSWLLSLLGVILILAILGGGLWAITTGPAALSALQGQPVRQDMSGIERAHLVIEPGAGYVSLHKLQEPVALIMGTAPASEVMTVEQIFSIQAGEANYELRSSEDAYRFPSPASNVFHWDLGLATGIPIDLKINLAAGEAVIDLSGLEISALQYDMGLGKVTLALPADGDFSASVEGAIGQVVILVPQEVGLQVQVGAPLVIVQAPDGYHKDGSTYTSANYASADHKIALNLGLAIGRVVIREQ
jgi:hypothetical protein